MTHFYRYLLILMLLFVGCSKPDPHPELRDPIYNDLGAKVSSLATSIETEKKNLEEASAKMTAASPQTGQIKYARKHYFEIKKKLEKLEQMQKYYQLRLKSREIEAQDSYLDAYDKKQADSWPNKSEFEEYQARESVRNKSRIWSVKERINSEASTSSAGTAGKPPSGGH